MLEKILETSNYVSSNSKHVSINTQNINILFEKYNFKKIKHYLFSNPFGILDLDVESIVNFLVIYDSINFSFWGNPKWEVETTIGKIDGSFALMYLLLELRKKYKKLDFTKIPYEVFCDSLKGNIEIPLLQERYKIVEEVSNIINLKMSGNFYRYIKNIITDVELFQVITTKFPSFKDERIYQEKTVYFYKLAQLLVSDILHVREIKEQIEIDYSHLIGCADYKIPQVLRNLGILEYDEELSDLVDNKKLILENSDYEIEIRANMIVALAELKRNMKEEASMIGINDFIWGLGQNKSNSIKPYHLTRTLSY